MKWNRIQTQSESFWLDWTWADCLQMVNLESQNLMQLSDFSASVLHEIFHPATTTSIDPKLVLSTRTAYLPPASISPDIKDHGSSSSPAPVPLSVHELERVDSKPELSHLVNVAVPVSSSSPPPSANVGGKSSPVDIVHLAAEEIRKPLLKFKDESKVENYLNVLFNLFEGIEPYPSTTKVSRRCKKKSIRAEKC